MSHKLTGHRGNEGSGPSLSHPLVTRYLLPLLANAREINYTYLD